MRTAVECLGRWSLNHSSLSCAVVGVATLGIGKPALAQGVSEALLEPALKVIMQRSEDTRGICGCGLHPDVEVASGSGYAACAH